MKNSHSLSRFALVLWFWFGFAAALSVCAADLAVTGNLTVTGTTTSAGAIDSDSNTFTFGTQGASFGGSLLYQDNGVDTLTFGINRSPASWLWQDGGGIKAMRLDSAHQLLLFNAAGTTAGITLTPASNQISLGTATLSGSGSNITVGGTLTANGNMNFTGADGSLALGASGVALSAVGGNKSVTLDTSGTGDLVFKTAGIERVRIKSTGNVGVGTANPGYQLHVAGDVGANGNISLLTTNSQINFTRNNGTPYVGGVGWHTDGYFYLGGHPSYGVLAGSDVRLRGFGASLLLGTAGADVLTINSAGNVGIGTTNPQTKLQVGAWNFFKDGTWAPPLAPGTSSAGERILFYQSSSWKTAIGMDGGNGIWFQAHTPPGQVAYQWFTGGNATAPVEKMRIMENGNVGIGTTSPSYKLSVATDSTIGFRLTTAGSTVGSPMIDLYDSTRGSETVISSTDGSVTGTYIATYTNHPLMFSTAAGPAKMTLTTAGNVGIGTTTPTHKLSVNGTIRAKEVIVDTGWADYVFEDDYRLAPLSEVEAHIRAKKHLPGIPSAAEVAAHGVSMGDMQSKLLSKVEELTLHLIAQEKRMSTQQGEIAELKASNVRLQQQLGEIGSNSHLR